MRPGKGHSDSRDPSVMASERASSGRGPSQLVATSKAAPPRGASSHALGASVHGPGASQPGTTSKAAPPRAASSLLLALLSMVLVLLSLGQLRRVLPTWTFPSARSTLA